MLCTVGYSSEFFNSPNTHQRGPLYKHVGSISIKAVTAVLVDAENQIHDLDIDAICNHDKIAQHVLSSSKLSVKVRLFETLKFEAHVYMMCRFQVIKILQSIYAPFPQKQGLEGLSESRMAYGRSDLMISSMNILLYRR